MKVVGAIPNEYVALKDIYQKFGKGLGVEFKPSLFVNSINRKSIRNLIVRVANFSTNAYYIDKSIVEDYKKYLSRSSLALKKQRQKLAVESAKALSKNQNPVDQFGIDKQPTTWKFGDKQYNQAFLAAYKQKIRELDSASQQSA